MQIAVDVVVVVDAFFLSISVRMKEQQEAYKWIYEQCHRFYSSIFSIDDHLRTTH